MLKVIRLDKREYGGGKYNNLKKINESLAEAKQQFVFECIPSKKKLRKQIMKKCNERKTCIVPVSNKDIKRMERAKKCEVPINIVDILEIIITEIINNKDDFEYRAPKNDNSIVSCHALNNTISAIRDFKDWLDAHDGGERPECDKYREEVKYVLKRLDEFNDKYPEIFNALFE